MRHIPAVLVAALVFFSVVGAGTVTGAQMATLTVSVVTPGGDPVSGATITASWEDGSNTATTASNGKAFVDVPQGASVQIGIEHPDYIRNSPLRIQDADEREVSVTVFRKGSLSLTITDANGPVDGALVIARKEGNVVLRKRTADDGTVATGEIESGSYTVQVRKPGYFTRTTSLDVAGSTEHEVGIESGAVDLSFTIVDDHFSPPKPVGDVEIRIQRDGRQVASVTTLESGNQQTQVPVNTVLRIVAEKDGYSRTVVSSFEIEESSRQVRLTLSRRPSVSLSVANDRVIAGQSVTVSTTNAYDEPAEGVTILLDGQPVGRTDAGGQLAVTVEDPGRHALRARTDGVQSEEVAVRAIVGRTTTAPPTSSTATATATASPTPLPPTSSPEDGGTLPVELPGFTATLAVLALLAAAALALRH